MSKEIIFNLSAHKSLWNWLAKHPDREKLEWPGWHRNGGTYRSATGCFACDYAQAMCAALENDKSSGECRRCPIWDEDNRCYTNEYEAYCQTQSDKEFSRAAEYAKAIADAKVRPGVKCK